MSPDISWFNKSCHPNDAGEEPPDKCPLTSLSLGQNRPHLAHTNIHIPHRIVILLYSIAIFEDESSSICITYTVLSHSSFVFVP